MYWPNGDEYHGEFRNDKMCGKGKLICKIGNLYDGNWENDMVCIDSYPSSM